MNDRAKPVFIKRTTPVGARRHRGLYLCGCGKEFEARVGDIASGNTTSCGCAKIGKRSGRITHGHHRGGKSSPTYDSWRSMVRRCTNPNHDSYPHYGGEGVLVHGPWLESFDRFLADVGERPSGTSLDRYPNKSGNYEPGNVRWATYQDQARNKRNNRMVTIGDLKIPLWKVCEKYQSAVHENNVGSRLKEGWNLRDALVKPLQRNPHATIQSNAGSSPWTT